jgi:thiol:disulfide interchange protein DsbC
MMQRLYVSGLGLAGLAASAGLAMSADPAFAEPPHAEVVAHLLSARLPRTPVTKVDCGKIAGLCEVQAGSNIFYVDPSARFLIVGRVYDMATRQDLTAARLLEINPDELLGGAASAQSSNHGAALGGEARTSTASPDAASQKVSLAELPASGAIEWGGTGRKVTVFSDFHCGYCRLLHQALKDMGVRVAERPISVLGTRAISDAVVCADNPAAAVEKAYSDQDISKRACDTSGLDANERFAREHGFSGTPVIVRDDGAVVLGFRPRAFLEAWLKGGA